MGIAKLSNLLAIARVNFLTLTLACLVLAITYSWQIAGAPSGFLLFWVTLAAISAHISVNAFNEYFDFRSGLDFLTPKTPFSGGSGTLIKEPRAAKLAFALAVVSLLLVVGIGAWIVSNNRSELLWLGIPGILLIYTYTHYINRIPFLCLIAPGVGFGLIMTMGAIWVFTGVLTSTSVLISSVVMLLVNNLLLLNQFPDCEADAQVGRRHYPILIGRKKSTWIFASQWMGAYVLVILGVYFAWLPVATLIVLLLLPLLVKLLIGVRKHANHIEQLVPLLGLNVALIHGFLLLLAVGVGLAI
ncbi:1,4-dihydroxy-2-naphthoate octaprenyltransferase [Idiomarina sp. A28L]|uniref:prenyltransferase n=1 Tax=Idiomarina sp. A28L TaxID=1036674 RepID=UPI0002138659|nr:prenyltransferase [Idiomarina sp. A28L]EGN75233.1 1,4-dihydroxy-2-naphthoate octaprenyltransferase [Idiomarina sp. A28L]